ncbi:hypothetical protein GGD81_003502 [Rhodobium orientis]|uniref:Alkaline proteinase inhibitor/ Outer membrane lipoprotein Omp19 domain-containing protein n=1 Tax=Rhodobium orientis TaxID=34017 RepID=A0A327JHX9_9HYPH|nr:AprI/Inh family metalloprotease inhibitor [Rhodobium orientis]MBB4304443.1 hypothetical protein [Rhodobium orientis]MBK5949968.1 hypothetical protein [Rhodobium orientis]RAI25591.1 hypothetical protein CH339_17485 [Rhodobium orientis]
MLRTAGSASIGATALFLALSAVTWVPAHAESSAPAIAAAWTIGDDFSNASCEAELGSEAGPKGARIAHLADCARLYPVLAPVRGWRPDGMGGIVLVDETGDAVVTYALGEADALLSVEPENVFLRLAPKDSGALITGAIGEAAD